MLVSEFSIGMQIYMSVVFGMLGAILGSFILCMVDRMIRHEDWIHGRSHCDVCHHPLALLDLIPIFSYVFHKGRCKYCGTKIPVSCLLSECGMFIVFVSLLYRYDISGSLLRYAGLSCILLAVGAYDMRTYLIPDSFHIAGIVWWIVTMPFMANDIKSQFSFALFGCLIAVMLLVVSLLFDRVTKKEGLGGGDIKLFFVVGMYFGFSVTMLILLFSCIIGLLFVVTLKRNKIPFGPSIALASYLGMLCGVMIVQWYLRLFIL